MTNNIYLHLLSRLTAILSIFFAYSFLSVETVRADIKTGQLITFSYQWSLKAVKTVSGTTKVGIRRVKSGYLYYLSGSESSGSGIIMSDSGKWYSRDESVGGLTYSYRGRYTLRGDTLLITIEEKSRAFAAVRYYFEINVSSGKCKPIALKLSTFGARSAGVRYTSYRFLNCSIR